MTVNQGGATKAGREGEEMEGNKSEGGRAVGSWRRSLPARGVSVREPAPEHIGWASAGVVQMSPTHL